MQIGGGEANRRESGVEGDAGVVRAAPALVQQIDRVRDEAPARSDACDPREGTRDSREGLPNAQQYIHCQLIEALILEPF
jgi:hypothetical protein